MFILNRISVPNEKSYYFPCCFNSFVLFVKKNERYSKFHDDFDFNYSSNPIRICIKYFDLEITLFMLTTALRNEEIKA